MCPEDQSVPADSACICQPGTTKTPDANDTTCCAPNPCPSGQSASCDGGVGSCRCEPGFTTAASLSQSLPVIGATSSQQCIPDCPSADAVDCTSGTCVCKSCPENSTIVVNDNGAECRQQCPQGSTEYRIHAREGCLYQTDTQGNYDYHGASCAEARAEFDGQDFFSGEVPACLQQQLTNLCALFDGKIHTRETHLPVECQEPRDEDLAELDILIAANTAAGVKYRAIERALFTAQLNDAPTEEIDALKGQLAESLSKWWTAYNAKEAKWDEFELDYEHCDPYLDNWLPSADDCALRTLNDLYVDEIAVLPVLKEIYSTDDFHLLNQRKKAEFEFSVNENCETIDSGSGCTTKDVTAIALYSPISLEVGSKKVEEIISASDFALDPNQKGKWFSWRASPDTPLLVIDTAGKGQITSASQLFGTFTFGKVWTDGYAPLATLDLDKDGALRGPELKNLALWFDEESDGISKRGEVKKLSEEGITAIFFKDAKTTPSQYLRIDIGFEKTKDGKVSTGSSVDWFSPSYRARDEAVAGASRTASIFRNGGLKASAQLSRDLPPTEAKRPLPLSGAVLAASAKKPGPLNGFWKWSIDANDNASAKNPAMSSSRGGMISLFERNGELQGHSYVETANGPSKKGGRQVVAVPFKGRVLGTSESGDTRFEFFIKRANGEMTKTTGLLSNEGGRLSAESLMTAPSKDGGLPAQIKYKWIAERMKI